MTGLSRRSLIAGMATLTVGAVPITRAMAATAAAPVAMPDQGLFQRALAAVDRHRSQLAAVDRIAVVDFAQASRDPRFYLLDLASGASRALLVAHGRGSDPEHSGWLKRFSNQPGSAASSSGAYVTAATYEGKHGRSRRLIGLDPQNSNAESRAIVVHAAAYVSASLARDAGKLGRSEGCFALAQGDLGPALDFLGSGRLIYADRVVG